MPIHVKDYVIQPSVPICHYCDKELYGRSDKKFCNDFCRNSYNRQRRKNRKEELSPEAQRTLRLIRKNFDILQNLRYTRQIPCVVEKAYLIDLGFTFKFCTSIYQTQKGEIWHYCFEYGWKETPDHKIMVGYDEQQVWI